MSQDDDYLSPYKKSYLVKNSHFDYYHLFVNMSPTMSPADFMRIMKANTTRTLRKEFPVLKQPMIWTRSYFVSTADVSSETIAWYVSNQKKKGVKNYGLNNEA